MRRRLQQWYGLAPWERRLLLQLTLLLPLIGAGLHLLGFKRTLDLLGRIAGHSLSPQPADPAREFDAARRLARLVGIAALHGPYRATCLRQALALWWLLGRRGICAEVRIGVRKDGSELQAHAWVEYKGEPLRDTRDAVAGYAAFGQAFPFEGHSRP